MRVVSYDRDGEMGVGEFEGGTIHRLEAGEMIEWLADGGSERTGETIDPAEVELLAPVPFPPSIRDFVGFGAQLEAMAKLRGASPPKGWRRSPAFHFSNPASICGPEEAIEAPATKALDFEVEIAAVLGGKGEIAGFTLLCDWTARDIEHRELAVGLGPHKSKDFATSLGPWLVTPDSLPYSDGQLELELTVAVDGTSVTRCETAGMQFPWPALVEEAARDTELVPGDLLASGALPAGSLIELGREALDPAGEEPWLLPGDTVEIRSDELGTLTVPID